MPGADGQDGNPKKQDYCANEGSNAENIDVTLFREIIFVPLTIDANDDGDHRLLTGRQRMQETIRLLDACEVWKRQEDLLKHLPEDRLDGQNANGAGGRGNGKGVDQEKQKLQDLKRRRSQYEEYVYFEPYVQRFLYTSAPRNRGGGLMRSSQNADAGAIALFFRDDIESIEVSYRVNEYGPEHPHPSARLRRYEFKVERCNLYLYETGNAVLVLELNLHVPSAGHNENTAAGDQSRNVAGVTLAECQTIIENLRRVFPPYFTEEEGRVGDPDAKLEAVYYAQEFSWTSSGPRAGVCVDPEKQIGQVIENPAGRAPPMFEPWRRILEPIAVEGSEGSTHAAAPRREEPRVRFGQTGDDRGFVMAQIGVPTSFDIRRSDWARLCFCDAPGAGYSYSRSFLERFEETYCYDRFFDYETKDAYKSTRYVMCSYAFIMVGSCRNVPTDYFYHLFSRHFRRIYFQLVLIGVYQKVALLSLSERLAEALDSRAFQDRSEAIHEEILMFTHRYWFEEISAQIQGHELFSMLRRHMRTENLYKQLSQEIRETTDRLAVLRQDRLNRLAGVGLVLATFVGFFGMNVFGKGELLGQVDWTLMVLFLVATAGFFAAIYFCGQHILRGQQIWTAASPAFRRLGAYWQKVEHEKLRILPGRPRPGNGGNREADPQARASR